MKLSAEMIGKCAEIMNRCENPDVRRSWTGDPDSITSASLRTIRKLEVSVEVRKREKRMSRHSAAEPSCPKAEPSFIDLWNDYKSDEWMGYGWAHVDDFWEACPRCDGSGEKDCSTCRGTGKRECAKCEGLGSYVTVE